MAQTKTEILGVRVAPQLKEGAKLLAKQQHLNLSKLIEKLIVEELEISNINPYPHCPLCGCNAQESDMFKRTLHHIKSTADMVDLDSIKDISSKAAITMIQKSLDFLE